jgi:hypothetical protein
MQRKNTFPQWHQVLVLLLALFAFFMTGLVAERVFEGLPHLEDELAYLFQAKVFAGGQVVVETPEPRSIYWQPFVIDSNTTGYRFGKYTPGWPALLALGVLMGQLWVVNGLLAALTVVLIYRFGREVFNPETGLIAALLTSFSPAALLLNGSLMSHTAGLFWTMLFVYAYWRMEKGQKAMIWGAVAGLALGALAASRPLTTVAIALPFVLWSGLRLLRELFTPIPPTAFPKALGKGELELDEDFEKAKNSDFMVQAQAGTHRFDNFWQNLKPLLLLSACTLLLASSIPAFSWVATGNPRQNLYELVWNYDKVGFGQSYGRNTHRLAKGYNHARFDLSLTSADLFGWQFTPVGDVEKNHFINEADTYPTTAYSFVLLPVGLLFGLLFYDRKRWISHLMWLSVWALLAFYWVNLPSELQNPNSHFRNIFETFQLMGTGLDGAYFSLVDDSRFSWIWIITALVWIYLPLVAFINNKSPQSAYTWLMLTLVLGIVVVQMTYWIGSQRYSTRYYYEALGAVAILTALPLGWLAQRVGRWLVLPALLALSIFTLYFYSTPRIDTLYHFNYVRGDLLTQVREEAVDDRPILVIVNGPTQPDSERVRWQAYGALLAVMSPYFDSEIVVVRDTGGLHDELIATYPDRQVVELDAVLYTSTVRESSP